jgi:hypothetical protein
VLRGSLDVVAAVADHQHPFRQRCQLRQRVGTTSALAERTPSGLAPAITSK